MSLGDVSPDDADFVKPGVIFGYRAISDYGCYSDGEGHVYNFGRSSQQCMLELRPTEGEAAGHFVQRQKDMLKEKMRRTGLNGPSRILMWVRVSDIEKYWDEFKRQLGGWGGRLQIDGPEPLVTKQLVVGDQFYTVENMGVAEFGTWVNALISKLQTKASNAALVLEHQDEVQPPVSLEV